MEYKVIPGPLLFKIFICDLFFFVSDSNTANYADDNKLYSAIKGPINALNDFEKDSDVLLKLFKKLTQTNRQKGPPLPVFPL